MRVTILQSRHRKPYHPLSHNLQKHEVEVCREKEMPQAEASLRNSIDRRKVLAPNRLVSIGILPHVNSIKRNLDVSSALSPHSRITRLTNNQIKSDRQRAQFPKWKRKRRQECCGTCEKCVTIGLCITRFRCTRFSQAESLEKARCKKSWDRFDKYGSLSLRHASIREKKGPSLGKILQVKKSSSAKSQRNAI